MELQKIKELIDILKGSDLAVLEFTQGDYKLRLVKQPGLGAATGPDPSLASSVPVTQRSEKPDGQVQPAVQGGDPMGIQGSRAGQVRSPLYGIVHLRPAPDSPEFVQIGDRLRQGQTLCLLEAMKIFHEVNAECDARLEAVLVADAQEVESGAHLFRLAPLN